MGSKFSYDTIRLSIPHICSYELVNALWAPVSISGNKADYFAQLIEYSMKGLGTRVRDLVSKEIGRELKWN